MSIGRGRKAALGLVAALAIVPSGTHAAADALPGKAAKAKAVAVRAEAAVPSLPKFSAGSAGKYANGRIPASALCPIGVGAHRLRCDAATGFKQLSRAYAQRFGGPLLVSDSYRSLAGQIRCRQEKGWLCAVPGTSNHGLGLAVDLAGPGHSCGTTEHRWLEANAGRYGWLWPSWARPTGSKTECWHWQYRTDN